MTATVRLDESLEEKLNSLTRQLHKKKSDVIREAIKFYAKNIENKQNSRMMLAIEKTKTADKELYDVLEETLGDAL